MEGKGQAKATDECGKLLAELEEQMNSNTRARDALDKEFRTALEDYVNFAQQLLSSVKEQMDVEIKTTKAGAKTISSYIA